jgi:hypothetical protein
MYGDVIILFHTMDMKHNKRLLLPDRSLNEFMFKQFSFFIYNCYACFNGNKLTKFFDMATPKLIVST